MSDNQTSKEQLQYALEDLESLCDHAYDNGFHELGYNPVKVLKDEIERLSADVERLRSNPARRNSQESGSEY